MEHVAELRRRLFYIVASVFVWSAAAYAIQHKIIDVLLEPSHGQKFIYTSPIGGMNFLFKVCIYVGVVMSIPVIVYHLLRYLEPLMKKSSNRFIALGSIASALAALGGIAFGYFFGLPAALHFLLNQFITSQVTALLTIENYLSFVTMYMVGAALMFQIPLIVLFINRIKPLTPSMLNKAQRWVILATVILAFIMNPTPSLVDQMFLAVPMVLSYELSIALIWWIDRRRGKVSQLRAHDSRLQAERQHRAESLRSTWQAANAIADSAETGLVSSVNLPPQPRTQPETAVAKPVQATAAKPAAASAKPARRHMDIARPTYQARPVHLVQRPRPLRSNYIQ